MFLDSLAGYALARLHFRGRKYVLALVIATLAVPGVVLLIPRFLVVKQLGLFNTYTGMIAPIAVDAAGIFLMRQFFLQVPVSLEESARLDGAGIFRTFWSIVLPAVRSGVIVLTIISFQGAWNEFAWYETATDSSSYWTLNDRPRQPHQRRSVGGDPVPAQACRRTGDDDPDRHPVFRLPAPARARPAGRSCQAVGTTSA